MVEDMEQVPVLDMVVVVVVVVILLVLLVIVGKVVLLVHQSLPDYATFL
jgi:hypothetical protein